MTEDRSSRLWRLWKRTRCKPWIYFPKRTIFENRKNFVDFLDTSHIFLFKDYFFPLSTSIWKIKIILNIQIVFLGDPIQCINDRGVPGHVINTYCWITYTFTLPHEQGKPVGTHVAHPGLGNDNQDRRYHSYYQWVPFVLFFQVSEHFFLF